MDKKMNLGRYILLIEDDADISEAVKSIIEEENYQVKCAFNGKEALEYLKSSDDMPSLILLDIMMPIMNGYEFREAQLDSPKIASIPTVVLSAAGKNEDLTHFHFTESLKKPLDLDTLVDVVKRNISPKL